MGRRSRISASRTLLIRYSPSLPLSSRKGERGVYYTIKRIYKTYLKSLFPTMLLTTTPTVEGYPVKQYLGIVSSETIIGANAIRDFMAGIRDFFGGRSGSYETVLREAKDTALNELTERAQQLGANAVVGIDLDYETVGANGSMLMVTASGTAVVL